MSSSPASPRAPAIHHAPPAGIRRPGTRRAVPLLILGAALLAVLGFWASGPRGLFADDYDFALKGARMLWHEALTQSRPGSFALYAALFSLPLGLQQLAQFAVLAAIAAVTFAILRTLTRDVAGAILGAALTMVPFFGVDVVLWRSTTSYTLGVLLALLAWYLVLRSSRAGTVRPWPLAGAAGLVLAAVLTFESTALILLPIAVRMAHLLERADRTNRRRLALFSLSFGLLYLVGVALVLRHYYGGGSVSMADLRGGLDLSPAAVTRQIGRFSDALFSFAWPPVSPRSFAVVWEFAADTLQRSPLLGTAFGLAAAALLAGALMVPAASTDAPAAKTAALQALAALVIGVTSIFFPAVLVSDQYFAGRLLYPLAICLGFAAGFGIAATRAAPAVLRRTALVGTSVVLVAQAIYVFGWAQVFLWQARYDELQARRFSEVFPPAAVSALLTGRERVQFVLAENRDFPLGRAFRSRGAFLPGILETSNQASYLLLTTYGHSLYDRLRWIEKGDLADRRPPRIVVQPDLRAARLAGADVPLDELVLFRWRAPRETFEVFEALQLPTSEVIPLPAGKRFVLAGARSAGTFVPPP